MLKAIIVFLLALTLVIFYGRGYVEPIEFGHNTLSMSSHYFLHWLEMLIVYLLLGKNMAIWIKWCVLFICFMFAIQFIIQFHERLQGQLPENNILSLYSCGIAFIITLVIYFLERKINGGST